MLAHHFDGLYMYLEYRRDRRGPSPATPVAVDASWHTIRGAARHPHRLPQKEERAGECRRVLRAQWTQ